MYLPLYKKTFVTLYFNTDSTTCAAAGLVIERSLVRVLFDALCFSFAFCDLFFFSFCQGS